MKKKILICVLICILIYITIIAIEFCCIYAIKGEDAPTFIKETLEWYCKLIRL